MSRKNEEEIIEIKRSISWALLKEALYKKGCPICFVVADAEKKYLKDILLEYALSPDVHMKLIKSFGLCKKHTWQIYEIENELGDDGLDLAVLFENVLNNEKELFEKNENFQNNSNSAKKSNKHNNLEKLKNQILDDLKSKRKCIGCECVERNELFFIHEMIKLVDDDEFRNMFTSANLLCRNHFNILVEEIKHQDDLLFFHNVQKEKLQKLQILLEKFIKNHDHKLRSQMTQEEKESIINLLNHFGGLK